VGGHDGGREMTDEGRVSMNARAAFDLLKATFAEWREDRAERLAAALAYYTMFSIAPLLLIAIAVAGLVFGEEAARGQVVGQLRGLVGQEGGEVIETAISNANRPAAGILATVVGLITLFLGASGVFGQLKDALNTIWEVKPKEGQGFIAVIKDRFLSLTMVLGVGFLLLTSLVISAALAALSDFLGGLLPGLEFFWQVVNFVISFAVVTLLFALIYKILPDVKIAWRDVWLGAAVTALLFTIGKTLLGLYIGNAGVGSAYGAAGSLLVILVWVYYSAQILFFGAEFTQVYAKQSGRRIVPEANAEPVTEEERAQQGTPRRADVAPDTRRATDAARTDGTRADVARETGEERGDEEAAPAPRPGGLKIGRLGTLLVAGVLAAIQARRGHDDERSPAGASPRPNRSNGERE
jgi:membrane protein